MRYTIAIIVVAACGGGGTTQAPPDAQSCEPLECFPSMSCDDTSGASIGGGPPSDCPQPGQFCDGSWVPCAQGCTVDFHTSQADLPVSYGAAVFCAETPAAQVGDSCEHGCLPTRAVVAADGTVTQQYLACGSGTCVAVDPPPAGDFLAACPDEVAAYGGPNVSGVAVGAFGIRCLIAWDAANARAVGGQTSDCIGDWECPAGALCDRFTRLDGGGALAVCRPGGPRGAPLDPARF